MGHARHMLAEDPRSAIIQLDEVLAVVPDYPPALLLKASAINRIDGPEASLELLAPLAAKHGQWSAVHFEHAKTLSMLKRGEAAIETLETVVALEPDHPEAWRMLADHLAAVGEQERSESAYLKHLRCSTQNAELQKAAKAMIDNNLSVAERVLKSHLQQAPFIVCSTRLIMLRLRQRSHRVPCRFIKGLADRLLQCG